MNYRLFPLPLALCFLLNWLPAQRYHFTHPAMGSLFALTVSTEDSTGLAGAVAAAFARIDALEQCLSDYRPDSELNQLRGSTGWREVSPDLYHVLRFSRQLARRSRGAFDPTVAPLTKVWRRAFRQQVFPAQEQISRARSQVHWKNLRVARGSPRVRLRQSFVALDLGGVGKGYALDAVAQVLREAGFSSFLLDGGGDLLLGERPTDAPGWRVAFPDGTVEEALMHTAVVTSGAAYRYLEWEGVRYSHLIDPRTGLGVTQQRTVTVLGPVGMVADGLASALSIGEVDLARHYPGYRVLITEPDP
ncbi:FAD:protein FMN transferase [Neolewinella lacunae]|uniref:FAD:protein FMN transferase n=1 Tax=Neolewinella lacunae TaxID=1517758 RepID=A0A923T9I2_9BACT|nr:FAD:protein FMN transferase [Neolewinella lacunae]MBC6996745.1 FAD:protein FMN transferase [Neolewinella lacunae]MDN3633390.1 FAD:protein FMN transferase [Neolewinella lacunae]